MTFALRYLPLFETDLAETADYIAHVLLNPQAASDLVDATEAAILRRLAAPDGYAPFASTKHRDHPYYTIPVKNYGALKTRCGLLVVFGDCLGCVWSGCGPGAGR